MTKNVIFFLNFVLDIGHNCYDWVVITGITFTGKLPKILDLFFKIFLDIDHNCYDWIIITEMTFIGKWPKRLQFF